MIWKDQSTIVQEKKHENWNNPESKNLARVKCMPFLLSLKKETAAITKTTRKTQAPQNNQFMPRLNITYVYKYQSNEEQLKVSPLCTAVIANHHWADAGLYFDLTAWKPTDADTNSHPTHIRTHTHRHVQIEYGHKIYMHEHSDNWQESNWKRKSTDFSTFICSCVAQ